MKAGLDYGGEKIGKLFRSIFFPTLLGMVFNAFVTIADGIFVGRGVGPAGIAAVNIIAPMYMVATGIGLMFGIGASVRSGILLSHGSSRAASVNMTHGFMAGTIVMALIVAFAFLFPRQLAGLLGCSPVLMPFALDYLLWILPCLIFLLWECMGLMLVRLDGSPRYAMMCNVVPAVLNIILDYIFVFPLRMGVAGAAIATSISVVVGGLMVVAYFVKFSYVLNFVAAKAAMVRNLVSQVVTGSSALITELAMSVMMLTGNYMFMKYYGESGVAAFSVACYLFPLMFMISNAVAQSAQPIISFNYGAHNPQRVVRALKVSLFTGVICGVLSTVMIAFGASWIVSMFIPDGGEAALLAERGLSIYAVGALFFAVNISFIGYYQSIDRGIVAMLLTLLRGVVVLVPLFILLPLLAPFEGLWGAIPLSEIVTFIVILITFRLGRRLDAPDHSN